MQSRTAFPGVDCDTHLVQISELQAQLDELHQRAAEQINAALQDGADAAKAAAAEAQKGGSTALQAAAEREAVLNATIADLRAEFEVSKQLPGR